MRIYKDLTNWGKNPFVIWDHPDCKTEEDFEKIRQLDLVKCSIIGYKNPYGSLALAQIYWPRRNRKITLNPK